MAAVGSEIVKVEEIEGRGRGLVASQPLRGGEILLRESPILIYSALSFINNNRNTYLYCDNCFRTLSSSSSSLLSCPSCFNHFFCSPNCLSTALSSSHSQWLCQSLNSLRNSLVSQPLELHVQARFLIAAFNLALVSPSNFQILLSLQGQPSNSGSDFAAAQFLHSLIYALCPPPHRFSLQLTAALLAKDKLNAFGLMEPFSPYADGVRSVRAYAIYPQASFFNHDCLPNACRFDYVDTASDQLCSTDIIVRLIHDVPQGREICLSYFPVNLNYSSRQRRLLEDYVFNCQCDRCKVEANWSDEEEDAAEEEAMDEEEEEEKMAASDTDVGTTQGDGDFPHAYFFLRYMCNQNNCWGTLAPLPPSDVDATSSSVLECNVCGNLKNDDQGINEDGDGGGDELSMDD